MATKESANNLLVGHSHIVGTIKSEFRGGAVFDRWPLNSDAALI